VEPILHRVGTADVWRELQILVPKFGEFDAALAALELVSEARALHRPEGVHAAVLPQPIQRLEPCRAERSSGRREVEIPGSCRADDLTPTRPEIPVERVGLPGLNGIRNVSRTAYR